MAKVFEVRTLYSNSEGVSTQIHEGFEVYKWNYEYVKNHGKNCVQACDGGYQAEDSPWTICWTEGAGYRPLPGEDGGQDPEVPGLLHLPGVHCSHCQLHRLGRRISQGPTHSGHEELHSEWPQTIITATGVQLF